MKNKKTVYIVLGCIGILLIGVLLFFAVNVFPKIRTGKEIANLLQPILTEENQAMHLDVSASIAGEALLLDSDVYMVNEEETSYFIMEQMNIPIYIVDNLLFFENGHAFKIAEGAARPEIDYKDLFLQIAAVYEIFDITCVKADLQSVYSVTVTGKQVQELLQMAMPMEQVNLEAIESLQVQLIAQEERLHEIKLSGSAVVDGTDVMIEISLSQFRILESGAYEIPEAVKQAVITVDESTLFNLTEDLYCLFIAFDKLTKQEAVNGSVTLHAECGIINFKNTYDLSELHAIDQESVNTEDLENIENLENLPSMIGFLCMEGEVRSIKTAQGYAYSITLDETSMLKISEMVAPELVNYVVTMKNGTVEVRLENESISLIVIEIDGSVNVLFTEVPAEVRVEFQYE